MRTRQSEDLDAEADDPDLPGLPDRRTRRRRLVLLLLLTVALVVAVAIPVARRRTGSDSPAVAVPLTTAAVVRTALGEEEQVTGTLGYGRVVPIVYEQSGTLTRVPVAGEVIQRGRPVFDVDGRPVPLFLGATPLWRRLALGCDDGADVRTVESNLRALGYAHLAEGTLTVDERFTSLTADAISRWSRRIGRGDTRSIAPGDVIVAPAAIRVAAVLGVPGAPAQGVVLRVTGTRPLVTVPMPADRVSSVRRHAPVAVRLPDGSSVAGHVQQVGTVATAPAAGAGGQPGVATVDVQITLDHALRGLDGAPVTVRLTGPVRRNVLAVPVTALLADGYDRYSVVVVTPNGSRRRLPVTLGLFARGLVEVRATGLTTGDRVEVAGT